MIEKHNHEAGIKIFVKSDIPSGVGLGSSSACCVAGAAAISRLFENTSKEEVLELAIEAEKTIFQNTSGADCTGLRESNHGDPCRHPGNVSWRADKRHRFCRSLIYPHEGLPHRQTEMHPGDRRRQNSVLRYR